MKNSITINKWYKNKLFCILTTVNLLLPHPVLLLCFQSSMSKVEILTNYRVWFLYTFCLCYSLAVFSLFLSDSGAKLLAGPIHILFLYKGFWIFVAVVCKSKNSVTWRKQDWYFFFLRNYKLKLVSVLQCSILLVKILFSVLNFR